jgi:hypothetical protein
MANVLKVYTTEDQHTLVRFLCAKGLSAEDIRKEMLPVYGGKCISCKAVHNWVEKQCKCFADDEEVEAEVRKRLRQKSKDFYSAGSTHY